MEGGGGLGSNSDDSDSDMSSSPTSSRRNVQDEDHLLGSPTWNIGEQPKLDPFCQGKQLDKEVEDMVGAEWPPSESQQFVVNRGKTCPVDYHSLGQRVIQKIRGFKEGCSRQQIVHRNHFDMDPTEMIHVHRALELAVKKGHLTLREGVYTVTDRMAPTLHVRKRVEECTSGKHGCVKKKMPKTSGK